MKINSTADYYKKKKSVSDMMLDEATLSHLLRNNNSFTSGGKPYGRLLCEFLEKNGGITGNISILEIGPGIGDIAKNIRTFMKEKNHNYRYTALDISEDILRKMRSLDFNTINSDCLDFETDEKYDLIIANEVISDLLSVVGLEDTEDEIARDSLRIINSYNLSLPDDKPNFNYGAIKLIENMRSLLNPGGFCFLSEHSSGGGNPERIPVKGHDEYTINFSHMIKVAKKLGFSIKKGSINDITGIEEDKKFVTGLLRPDMRELYRDEKDDPKIIEIMSGIFTPDEFIEKLVDAHILNVYNIAKYSEFLKNKAEPITKLINQFEYILIRK